MKLPPHECELSLSHNAHKNYYKTVAECVADRECGYVVWASEEQKQKAIETNDCWILQWYPKTPNGFRQLTAADLDVLLNAAVADV